MNNNEITPIASFTVNHEILDPGFYISRIDGNIITSRGAGTAMEFALTLVETVVSPAERKRQYNAILCG